MKVAFLIQPNGKRTEFITVHNGKIKVKVAAKPIDNLANEELISFLADRLSISKAKISIAHGNKSKDKLLEILYDITVEEIIAKIK